MIFINFKTYEQGSGVNALELLEVLENVAKDEQAKIIPVVQATDILEAVQTTSLEVWVQHTDSDEFGAHTGHILPEAVKEDGAMGTFLNHSEHRFETFTELEKANERAMEVGLKTLIFSGDVEELKKASKLSPTFLSYEPPELVGSKTTSVAKAKPDVIAKAVEVAHEARLPLIVGAGIKSQKDVEVSVKLGADGVAVASDVVKAKDPEKELRELVAGFK